MEFALKFLNGGAGSLASYLAAHVLLCLLSAFFIAGLLIAGTLKLWPLTASVLTVNLPLSWAQAWQDTLYSWVTFDSAKSEEGVSFQGSVLGVPIAGSLKPSSGKPPVQPMCKPILSRCLT